MTKAKVRRRNSYELIFKSDKVSEFSKIAVVVCVFVMIREFRPVEPFFTSYLTSPPLNFTTEQVNEQIYPIGTYSSFSFVVVIFLITDYLRYKPIIILDGVTGILTYALLFGKPEMSIFFVEQIFYGFFYSSEIACNTYLYAKLEDTTQYQKITGYVRASSLLGRFLSGVFAQVTISSNLLRQSDLIYFSTGGMVIVTLWAFIIPPVERSIYFHKVEKINIRPTNENYLKTVTEVENVRIGVSDFEYGKVKTSTITIIKSEKLTTVIKRLWHDFFTAYTNFYVLKWSFWWSFALCGYFFVVTYSQVLWQTVANTYGGNQYLMNGAVESVYTITSAFAAYLITRLKLNWKAHSDWILTLVSLTLSALLLFQYSCNSLWFIYLTYVIYGAGFQTMYTIAQSEVAQHLERDSYALIFGFNLFVALGLGSFLTYTVIEGNLIYFTTRQQFLFYGSFYCVLAAIFAMKAGFTGCKNLLTS